LLESSEIVIVRTRESEMLENMEGVEGMLAA